MKYLRLRLRFDEAAIHPMQRFVRDSDRVERDLLLHGTTGTDGFDTLLFYVEGDVDPYAAALEAVDSIHDYDISRLDDDGFYAYIEQEPSDLDETLFDTFSRPGVIVVPPVEFGSDGTAELTILGKPAALQSALESIPDAVDADVERIGEYDGGRTGFDPGLTDRQYEAVAAAVEGGYYETPAECSVEDVAAELDCASGTAAEHLRKAERKVMRELVAQRRFE